jgi:uncharacterized surface protein with fasciclin (FAS1) repeats
MKMTNAWKKKGIGLLAATALAVGLGVTALAASGGQQKKDIVETAVAAGQFNTLVKALQAAELVDTLKGEGPFTVFAPTDEAFSKLPPGTLEDLLKPENRAKLTSILTYHVVSGKVMMEQAMKLTSAKTLNGQDLTLRGENGKLMVNDATVTQPDIQCSNGVIHVINQVLMPQ